MTRERRPIQMTEREQEAARKIQKEKTQKKLNDFYDKYLIAEANGDRMAPLFKSFAQLFFKMNQTMDMVSDFTLIFSTMDYMFQTTNGFMADIQKFIENIIAGQNVFSSRMQYKKILKKFKKSVVGQLKGIKNIGAMLSTITDDFDYMLDDINTSFNIGSKKKKRKKSPKGGESAPVDAALNDLLAQRRAELVASGQISETATVKTETGGTDKRGDIFDVDDLV